MITLDFIYALMGLMVGGVALVNLLTRDNPKRLRNAAFWGIYATTFLAGSHLPDVVNGCLVIAMVLVASAGGLGQGCAQRQVAALRHAGKHGALNVEVVEQAEEIGR